MPKKKKVEEDLLEDSGLIEIDNTAAEIHYNELLHLHNKLLELNVRSIGDLENLIARAEKAL